MSSTETTLDMKKLEGLIKAMNTDPRARVGILGNRNARTGAENSNATIGLKHEFGDPKEHLPIRSFLRLPLALELQKQLKKSGMFDEDILKEVINQQSIIPWIKRIGIVGEICVLGAFQTGGYGQWKPSNMKYKFNQQTLVETTQLRGSITSDVVES